MIAHTAPRIPAVAVFTPSRMSRVKPYHLAYVGVGVVDSVCSEGTREPVCVEPLALLEPTGPDNATDSLCGTASRNASASSFFCSAQPVTTFSARAQPPNHSPAFAYIVCGLLQNPAA